jgi:hypothetical protein
MRIPIAVLADLHLGLKTCRIDMIKGVVKWILENKALWWGGGDFSEYATIKSPGVYEQMMTPDDQQELFIKLVKPIRHLCIGLIRGNHEDRIWRETGIDPLSTLCRELDVNVLGVEAGGYIKRSYSTGTCTYTWYISHSKTANKTAGLALNWTEREIGGWINTDIIIKCHGHDMGYTPFETWGVNVKNNGWSIRWHYIWLPGHFSGRAAYMAQRAAKPKPCGTVVGFLRMNKDKRHFEPKYMLEGDLT